jgi:uncharacterized phage infection (PIP) family protein YhgE
MPLFDERSVIQMIDTKHDKSRRISRAMMAFGIGAALMTGAGTALAASSGYAEMDETEFSSWAEQQMNTLEEKWTAVRSDVAEASEDASREAKAKWQALVEGVNDEREQAARVVDELQEGAVDNWEALNEKTRKAIAEFDDGIESLRDSLSNEQASISSSNLVTDDGEDALQDRARDQTTVDTVLPATK